MRSKNDSKPGYYAVIFISQLRDDDPAYDKMAKDMEELARNQKGFIELESVRDHMGQGITVSYWKDKASIQSWKLDVDHLAAQKAGREKWYSEYRVRIARVEKDYQFKSE
jgi:heme-degrading monooxygenase HmoA